MGIDVNLYAEGHVTNDRVTEATDYLKRRCSIADDFDGKWPLLSRDNGYDQPRLTLSTMSRFYGPSYERGDWPSIYGAIRLMQAALPNCRVFYGGDCDEDGQECTEEFLSEMWEHFLGRHGDDYRTEIRAGNASNR